ncbi:hypothetical protein FE257_005323 [Aspergillus nanangensis]|uniref:Uncharacterized protein n=1 Tax=Aspergillus nanangensis TaxID=2582783 RepID=A0AAD4CA97_ASPNN|nr:hypothetical protein FE257_005323 [Aspergillus nanangensis]
MGMAVQSMLQMARGGIPDLNGLVMGARGQLLAIGREGHRQDRIGMAVKGMLQMARGGSQILMVLSWEPEASCWPSGEKATDRTQSEWPSSVRNSGPHVSSTIGHRYIQAGMSFANVCLIIVIFGANMRPET